jgi:hypothetical protein
MVVFRVHEFHTACNDFLLHAWFVVSSLNLSKFAINWLDNFSITLTSTTGSVITKELPIPTCRLFIFLDKIENEHGKNELKASA